MLRDKAKDAVLWSGLFTLTRQGLGFVVAVILARLLVPDDFGTVALLAIFIGIANLFVSAGLGLALIQRQDVTHIDESTVFWFNLGAASVIALGLFFAAGSIASFFGKSVLVPLTRVLALNIFVGALGTVQSTLMTKQLDFKTPTVIGVWTSIFSSLVAVCMALNGFGLWSLAGQSLTATVLEVALLWRFSPWRPAIVFRIESFRKLFRFGGWLFLSGLLDVVYQRGYTLLIGKFYGTHDLGIYNRADSTQSQASGALTEVLAKVAFPLFSAVNNDLESTRRGMKLAIQTMMLVTAPAMMGLAVLANPFIAYVFGEPWIPAAPILQVLCFVGLLYPLQVINLTVLQAQGHSNLFFRLELAKKLLGIGLLVVGAFFGLLGIAVARALSSALALLINGFYSKKFINYGVMTQVIHSGSSLVFSLLMAALIWIVQDRLVVNGLTGVVSFCVLIAIGAGSYIALHFLFRSEALVRAQKMIFN